MSVFRILIVDDQVEIRNVLRSLLGTLGPKYQVVAVPSGEEALLEFFSGDIDLLITDIVLPGIDGIEFMKKAIQLNPLPPAFYLHQLGHAYRAAGQYDKAIEAYNKSIKREPNNIFAHAGLTVTYSYMGHEKEAHEAALELLKIDPEFSLKNFAKTFPVKNPDKLKRFIEALRKAGLK